MICLAACGDIDEPAGRGDVIMDPVANITNSAIEEASGLQASPDGERLYVVNDSGNDAEVFLVGLDGSDLGQLDVRGASNRDWEGLALIPGPDGPRLVIGDIGDNNAVRSAVRLYLVEEANLRPGRDEVEVAVTLELTYPDGPRDAESIAWDPFGERLLIMSKRDRPPRIYAVASEALATSGPVTAEFLGTFDRIPPPSQAEITRDRRQGRWIAQPNGMDIGPDGLSAVVVTYRGLYVFAREPGRDWVEALRTAPWHIPYPIFLDAESVTFAADQAGIWVTLEGDNPPLLWFQRAGEAQSNDAP